VPIVAHSALPTFADLRGRGEPILTLDDALHQDIRELHIGLLNMMPDAALRVTEQQFIRLVGSANQIVQLYVHPFTVPGLERSAETQAYLDTHYERFEDLQRDGLDGLIVTGANVAGPDLTVQPFYEPLAEVMTWAHEHVTSTLCSCLATHALVERFHGIHRRPLAAKRWGVYSHRVVTPGHPLLLGTNTRFDVPHSRWNEVTSAQLREVGVRVLVESVEGDFHLGTSVDGIRTIYLQGHPEYDAVSLLKEYRRELDRFVAGELDALPPTPANYLTPEASRLVHDHVELLLRARESGTTPPAFPEATILPYLDTTWTDTGRAMFNNWLGLIYRLTDVQRGVPFMPGIDPDDPLGLVGARQ
jgi:homoserine O-succinyltransferase/O-acetyltransferase